MKAKETTNGNGLKRAKNPAAVSLGRRGGSVRSPAKRAAARANALKYWAAVRAGEIVRPRRRGADKETRRGGQ